LLGLNRMALQQVVDLSINGNNRIEDTDMFVAVELDEDLWLCHVSPAIAVGLQGGRESFSAKRLSDYESLWPKKTPDPVYRIKKKRPPPRLTPAMGD